MGLVKEIPVNFAQIHKWRFSGRLKRKTMEWGALDEEFDKIVGQADQRLHFLRLRAIQNQAVEMWYAQSFPSCLFSSISRREIARNCHLYTAWKSVYIARRDLEHDWKIFRDQSIVFDIAYESIEEFYAML